MKIRLGFVANSSSSDYILPDYMGSEEDDCCDHSKEDDDLTYEEYVQEKHLKKLINIAKQSKQQEFSFVYEEF